MLVSGAEDDDVKVVLGAVAKVRGVAFEVSDEGALHCVPGPVVAHGCRAVAKGDGGGTHFVGLHADVLGGVAAADHE